MSRRDRLHQLCTVTCKLCFATISAILLGGAVTVLADTCKPYPLSGCGGTKSPCFNFDNRWDTGVQSMFGGADDPYPQFVADSISTFNPSPVYGSSNAWVALEQREQVLLLWAQAGYDHDVSVFPDGSLHSFAQWTRDDGTIFDAEFGEKLAENEGLALSVQRSPDQVLGYPYVIFSMEVRAPEGTDDFDSTGDDLTWGSDSIETGGEILDYDPTLDQGSHAVGNQSSGPPILV